jgi:Flp pilus assembly protein TadG
MRVRLASFGAAEDGAAAVQFALLLPSMLLFLLGSIECAMTIFVSSTLEAAVLSASRYGITGALVGASREQRIREIIAERTFGFVNMSTVDIRTLVYPSFSAIGTSEPYNDGNRNGRRDTGESYTDSNGNNQWDMDMGAAGVGGPGDVVLYDVRYTTNGFTKFMQPIFGGFLHQATVAVRNESF